MPKNILIIAGLDPSGGAGLAADIQTASSFGVHPAPVASLLTVQDTINVQEVKPLEPKFVIDQAKAVLEDLDISAIKLGALGTALIGSAVSKLLLQFPDIPVVTDPVLVAAGGGKLAEQKLIDVYRNKLFPLSAVATPNKEEFGTLTNGSLNSLALLEAGLAACFVTDGEGAGKEITHKLYTLSGVKKIKNGKRLPASFHGSGCTLASAIASRLALGDNLETAITKATSYVEKAVASGFKPGKKANGQMVPKRL